MDSEAKGKAGVATVGIMAVLAGLVGDCGSIGARACRHADDVAGLARHGDDIALAGRSLGGAGHVARHADELGLAGARGTGFEFGGASWADLAADALGSAVDVGFSASDLLTDTAEMADTAEMGDTGEMGDERSVDGTRDALGELLLTRVSAPEVAFIFPLYEDASFEDRELREELASDGVARLDAPSSLLSILERRRSPLLIVARIGSEEGTLKAPDGSDVPVEPLLSGCQDHLVDCAALVCNTEATACSRAAYQVARATIAARRETTQDFYATLLSGRYAAADAGSFDIFRLTRGRLVRSDGASGQRIDDGTGPEAPGPPRHAESADGSDSR